MTSVDKIVVFWDNDGTLVESEKVAMKIAVKRAFEFLQRGSNGLATFTQDEVSHFVNKLMGRHLSQIINDIAQYLISSNRLSELPTEIEKALYVRETFDVTVKALRKVDAVEGIPAIVDLLDDYAVPQYIVTSSERARVLPGLKRNVKFAQVFDLEKGLLSEGDDCSRKKPDPEVYLLAIHRWTQDGDFTIAIEDSQTGVEAAVAAGVDFVIGVSIATHIKHKDAHDRELVASGADASVFDARELKAMLTEANRLRMRDNGKLKSALRAYANELSLEPRNLA